MPHILGQRHLHNAQEAQTVTKINNKSLKIIIQSILLKGKQSSSNSKNSENMKSIKKNNKCFGTNGFICEFCASFVNALEIKTHSKAGQRVQYQQTAIEWDPLDLLGKKPEILINIIGQQKADLSSAGLTPGSEISGTRLSTLRCFFWVGTKTKKGFDS